MSFCHKYLALECRGCPYDNKAQPCSNHREQYQRDINTKEAKQFFKEKGIEVGEDYHGLLLDNRYVFSPKSFKWKAVGKAKWYRSKGHEDFFNRFFS